jgi:hypothetical protein
MSLKNDLTQIIVNKMNDLGLQKIEILEFGSSFFSADTMESDYDIVIAVESLETENLLSRRR